jgi:hypothetical protein
MSKNALSANLSCYSYIYLIDQVLLPPTIGELLDITSDVTTIFNFTTFVSLVEGPAHLGNLLSSQVEGYPDVGKRSGNQSSQYLTVFALEEGAFVGQIGPFISRWLQSEWLLHLQNFVLNHFTVSTFQDSYGGYNLTMLSGFPTTVQVWSPGNDFAPSNKTVNGIPIQAVPDTTNSEMAAEFGYVLLKSMIFKSAAGSFAHADSYSLHCVNEESFT